MSTERPLTYHPTHQSTICCTLNSLSLNSSSRTQMCLSFLFYNCSWISLQLSDITGRNCQLKPNQHSAKVGARPSTAHFLPIFDLLVPCASESSENMEDAIGGKKDKEEGFDSLCLVSSSLINYGILGFMQRQLAGQIPSCCTVEFSDSCRDNSQVRFPPVAVLEHGEGSAV